MVPFVCELPNHGKEQIIDNTNVIYLIYFYLMCMGIPSACMSVYHMHACCLWREEEDIRSPGPRVIGGCKPLYGCWGLNLGPLREQPKLLTTESSFQALNQFKFLY